MVWTNCFKYEIVGNQTFWAFDYIYVQAVVYAESFLGGPKFCHNPVMSQINMESAKGTTILGFFTEKSKSRANPKYS